MPSTATQVRARNSKALAAIGRICETDARDAQPPSLHASKHRLYIQTLECGDVDIDNAFGGIVRDNFKVRQQLRSLHWQKFG
jgi:hypothetical protein